MSQERVDEDALRVQQAVAELEALIQSRFPSATFTVGPGGEDPIGSYITATVDVNDPDVVLDLVIDRVVELQVEEGLPVYVIPIRTPERIAERLRQPASGGISPSSRRAE